MKTDEVVSATAGKEEALTSALAEITHLKEEILTKTYVLSLYHIAKFTVFWLDETYFFLHAVLKSLKWKFRYLV